MASTNSATLSSPFPYVGGKSRPAQIVRERFGKADIYVEPFFGSGKMLLTAYPTPHKWEIVNDIDCLLTNAWRGIIYYPDETAEAVQKTVNHIELEAARRMLGRWARAEERIKLLDDVEFCDIEVAGWWLWAISNTIAQEELGSHFQNEAFNLGRAPVIGHSAGSGHGLQACKLSTHHIEEYFQALHRRLFRTIVFNSDWRTCVSPSKTGQSASKKNTCSIFFDPPYITETRKQLYAVDSKFVALEVLEWCKENEDNPNFRIALCGLDGEYDLPDWEKVHWTDDYRIMGGKSLPSERGGHSRVETIWFSPHCLKPTNQMRLM